MVKAKYIFTRTNGFFSTNRASTDAINALNAWSSHKQTWSYETEADEEDSLVAVLTLDDNDTEIAGIKLQNACKEYGIERTHVPD